MPARLTCPCCGRRLRAPDHLAARQAICPGCKAAIPVPPTDASLEEGIAAAGAAAPGPAPEPHEPDVLDLPRHARLGLASVALGLLSVLVLCLPVVGYAAIALSGLGLLLGVYALAAAWLAGAPVTGGPPAGGGVAGPFGASAVNYPLAGVGACAVALALALLPLLGG
jgi:hypothetical protein